MFLWGGYFQFLTKNRPQKHQKRAILHTSQANGGGSSPPAPPGYATAYTLPFTVQVFSTPNSCCASFKSCILRFVKDSVIIIPVPASFYLDKKTSFLMLLRTNLIIIVFFGGLSLLFFLPAEGKKWAMSTSFGESFSVICKAVLSLSTTLFTKTEWLFEDKMPVP